MDALIGLVWIVGLAYGLLRLLSWAYHCWDRGWWFQNPRTMEIRQVNQWVSSSAGFAAYCQWRTTNSSSNLSFQDWKKQLENEEFWREWREQDDHDRYFKLGVYSSCLDRGDD
jgi:hypothetical protein